jgi:hypothetical protein
MNNCAYDDVVDGDGHLSGSRIDTKHLLEVMTVGVGQSPVEGHILSTPDRQRDEIVRVSQHDVLSSG